MFLSHPTIEKYIHDGLIIIKPTFNIKNLRPLGLRIHLGKNIMIPEPGQTVEISGGSQPRYREVDLEKEIFYLKPNQFILGSTYEAVQTAKDIVGILDGRSTIARIGLTVHITSSIVDGAFEMPYVTVLEIKNVGNFRVRLKYKDPVAMMLFAQLSEPVTQKVQSQYGPNQNTVTPPNLKFKTGHDS
jgi:dCTP deaminase